VKIAYLTPQYPKVSHSFIRREIHELERRGHEILRFSIRRTPAELLVDPADQAEGARTQACLAAGAGVLLLAGLRVALREPAATARLLSQALLGRMPGGRDPVRRFAYLLEAAWLLERFRAEGVEHVHVHFGTNAATVARLVGELGGPPFSLTVHGPDELDDPWGHGLPENVAASRFTVAISHFTSGQLRRFVGRDQWPKLRVVRCSIDESFLEATHPIDPASRTFVCVGRLTPQKGQLILLEAFAELVRQAPEARLVMAGDGELRGDLEARVTELGLGDHVQITGYLSEAEVREQLRSARCFVLPSFAEGLPVVIMEALAMGRPVISTYVAGIPELVRPGENGWLVPAADTASLTEALREALATPAERLSEMGEEGARRVRKRHWLASEVSELEDALRR